MSRTEAHLSRALGAVAGISFWLSLGHLVVTADDTRLRVIALAPLWLLLISVVASVSVAWAMAPSLRRVAPLALTVLLWLPYLPGAIPPAFLIWYGPIQTGVWILTALALVAVNLPAIAASSAIARPTTAPWFAATVATLLFAGGAMVLHDQLPLGDEPHYLMMTQSLLKDGDLRIENNHQNRDYASFSAVDIPPHYLARGVDGQIYSSHAPGVSVLVLPAFAAFGYHGGVATVLLCVALASAVAWHAAWLLTASSAAAWLAWAAIFITAPVYLHAITVFPDAVGTLPVVAAVWLLVAMETSRPLKARTLVAVGTLLAALPWLHSRFAIIAAGLGLAITCRLVRRPRHAVAFLSVPIISGALWLGFFWVIWGSPNPAAAWGSGLTAKVAWIPRGIVGLLLDQQAGLIPSAPVYLCALWGAVVLLRQRPRLAIETALIGLALMASVASYEPWWGGHGGPARYIVAILPLALPAIAVGSASAKSWSRSTTVVTVAVSLLFLVAKITHDHGSSAFAPEGGLNLMLRWLSGSVDLSQTLPSLVGTRDAHFVPLEWPAALPIVAVWALAAAATSAVCLVFIGTAYRLTITVLAAAMVVMTATSAVWWMNGHSGLTPLRSQAAFIEQWRPDRQPLALQWRRPYRPFPSEVARQLELIVPTDRGVDVPAGDYEIVVDQAAPPSRGELAITVGNSPQPLSTWELAATTTSAPLTFRLPVNAVAVRFTTTSANATTVRLRLTAPRLLTTAGRALQTAVLGGVQVFFLDSHAYGEPTGFWIPAGIETRLLLDRRREPARSLGLRLQAGPVATSVHLESDAGRTDVGLDPHQRHETVIAPTATGIWTVSLQPGAGFRPVDFDPLNHDSRNLGVWVEVF